MSICIVWRTLFLSSLIVPAIALAETTSPATAPTSIKAELEKLRAGNVEFKGWVIETDGSIGPLPQQFPAIKGLLPSVEVAPGCGAPLRAPPPLYPFGREFTPTAPQDWRFAGSGNTWHYLVPTEQPTK